MGFCGHIWFSGTDRPSDTDKEGAVVDPLAALEKTTEAKKLVENVQKPRIESLQSVSEHFNADPYSLSLKARKKFREEKKVEEKKRSADEALRSRYGLPATLSLLEEDERLVQEAKDQWEKAKEEQRLRDVKRRKITAGATSIPSSSRPSSSSNSSSKAVDSLRTKLLQNTAKRASTLRSVRS